MSKLYLQDMIDNVRFEALPINWTSFNLKTFSAKKSLWDYQQKAVENAIKVIWKYYEDFIDYRAGESLDVNQARKQKFFEWYRDNGQDEDLSISLNRANRNISHLLTEYYASDNGRVPYEHFINRMCFWMATGSGKTLVLVKLIQVLRDLIRLGELPPYDILVLTHRDDLIDQLKVHVNEFNSAHSDIFIRLKELREYATTKWENPSLFKDHELTVFYYRSDNLSDEQKEKLIDFKNYDDEGKWYILLDEAHKGDKEDSKRQHIYSILSRNGFLFNFSATFTDERDLITTAYNFNLSEFIKAGYGKHIAILRQEIRAFRNDEDYNDEEKQKVVLKSLMILAYVRNFYEDIRSLKAELYHKPLLLTLVNSVNTQDADLKLFFRELERIGKGEINDDVWKQAINELWDELKEKPSLVFEEDSIEMEEQTLKSLCKEDILRYVYNSSSTGEIEILVRPSNKHELAFKLKTSDKPFALIKIGDISGWLKEELAGYEVNESFENESYFERLNEDDSDINILMGSRSFYEGWDSNRPNVINFINIGTGTDAKKFILQSIGRGVRIEPIKNQRKRLIPLYNAKEVAENLFHQVKDKVLPIETLFIFGTNRNALLTVIEKLDQEKEKEGERQLSLFVVNEEAKNRKLLIPTYKEADQPIIRQRSLSKFEISQTELDLMKRYIDFIQDDRIILAMYEIEPEKIKILRDSLNNPNNYYKHDDRSFKNINLLVRRTLDYFGVVPEEFDMLKELKDEIRHFKNIKVSLRDICELQKKVETVKSYQDPEDLKKDLKKKFESKEITLDEYTEGIEKTARMVKEEAVEYQGKRLRIKHIANHYYIPVIVSEDERVDYIKHIIKTQSEVRFINDLEKYLIQGNNKFKEFDWWLFSKLDEHLDEICIPYYDPKTNNIRQFNPDFIFWLQKRDDYFIVFIDPKSASHTDYEHKVDGYKMIFEEDNGSKVLNHDELKVRVLAFLYTDDVNSLSQEGYRKYWFDDIGKALMSVSNGFRPEKAGRL